jgi:hypothetical protein
VFINSLWRALPLLYVHRVMRPNLYVNSDPTIHEIPTTIFWSTDHAVFTWTEVQGDRKVMQGFLARGLLIALMMEAASTPGKLVTFYQTTRRNNSEDSYLQVNFVASSTVWCFKIKNKSKSKSKSSNFLSIIHLKIQLTVLFATLHLLFKHTTLTEHLSCYIKFNEGRYR